MCFSFFKYNDYLDINKYLFNMTQTRDIIKKILTEARKKKGRPTELIIRTKVPSKITVYHSEHNLDQMRNRPSCTKNPKKGCYDPRRGERAIPISKDAVSKGISDRKKHIISVINSGKFKRIRTQDTSQHLGLISYRDEISKIWTLLSLSTIGPFEYMVRTESSRRWNGRGYLSDSTIPIGPMNETFRGMDTRDEIVDFGTIDINTTFKIVMSGMVKNRIADGIEYLDYDNDEVVLINEPLLLSKLKDNLVGLVDSWDGNPGTSIFVTDDGISITYTLTPQNEPTVTKYLLTMMDINVHI
jgi:hypothetical protein